MSMSMASGGGMNMTGGVIPPARPVTTAGNGAGGGTGCGEPCEIPVFCRNYYYRGKLLTEREFADEQRYFVDKGRLHNIALHGWGVACGLDIRPHQYCPELRLVIEPGLAIDSCGRDIRVLKEVTIDLPQPPPRRLGPPPPPPPPATGANGEPAAAGAPAEAVCVPELPAQTLYLCLVYAECDSELAPAPFDECGCNAGNALKPNRICEGFRLELYDTKPWFWDEAVGDECAAEDCRVYYREGQDCKPLRPDICCVPLAVIMDLIPGTALKREQIRTHGYRRRIASTETIDRVVRCILEKLPAEKLTRIIDTNWEHNQRYLCRDFISDFIGTPEAARGFRITFSDKVNAQNIDVRSFQALVVFHSDDPAQPWATEIAPAEIQMDTGQTDWCRLRIDQNYARNRLDMKRFDLFLTLKCDVITDARDLAVDGNFIAHRFPTGDNVQGGTFESWIRIWPRTIPA